MEQLNSVYPAGPAMPIVVSREVFVPLARH